MSRPHSLAHFMRRYHHDRAQCGYPLVIDTAPVDGHAEETGRTQCFDSRVVFFQVATHTLFAVIHTEYKLCIGAHGTRLPATAPVVGGDGVEQLLAVVPFIGLQPQVAGVLFIDRFHAGKDHIHLGDIQAAHRRATQAQLLHHPEQRPGAAEYRVAFRLVRRRAALPGPDQVREVQPLLGIDVTGV